MGGVFTKIAQKLGAKETRILMIGLDSAGKTTIIFRLKLGEVVTTIPTIGFNVETIEYKKLKMTIWDVGGQDKIRELWKHYFVNCKGLIFVVDSNDRERLDEVAEELHKLLAADELSSAPILVFANKQDLPNALNLQQITECLQMQKFKSHKWLIQPCSAHTGAGLYEGLDWLSRTIYP